MGLEDDLKTKKKYCALSERKVSYKKRRKHLEKWNDKNIDKGTLNRKRDNKTTDRNQTGSCEEKRSKYWTKKTINTLRSWRTTILNVQVWTTADTGWNKHENQESRMIDDIENK